MALRPRAVAKERVEKKEGTTNKENRRRLKQYYYPELNASVQLFHYIMLNFTKNNVYFFPLEMIMKMQGNFLVEEKKLCIVGFVMKLTFFQPRP